MRGKAREALKAFLISLSSGRYADAERALDSLVKRLEKRGEWGRGYLQALKGMLNARRTGDKHAFYLTLEEEAGELRRLRREFREHTRARGHTDYDKGFFSAWKDVISIALELKRQAT